MFLKNIVRSLSIAFGITLALASCSNDEYMNTIPANCEAIASFNTEQMQPQVLDVIGKTLGIKDVSAIGLDYEARMFAFQTKTGYYGLCAKIADSDQTEDFFNTQQAAIKAQPLRKKSGFFLTAVQDKWVVGFSNDALLLLGPVAPSNIAVAQQQIVTYLKQEEIGESNSRLLTMIDSIQSPLALVARAQALPSSVVLPFTLGVSDKAKNGEMAKVYVTAGLTFKEECVLIEGSSFSFDANVNKKLQDGRSVFRPIKGKYIPSASAQSAVSLYANVDGKDFLPMLKNSGSAVTSLLTMLNTAIDFDKIVMSIDGDLSLQLHSALGENTTFAFAAELKHHDWLADIPYWKQSCPQGVSLTECGNGLYSYSNGSSSYFFGLTPDNQFYSGTTAEDAQASLTSSPTPLPASLSQNIKGNRLVFIVNAEKLLGGNEAAKNIVNNVLGQSKMIVYTMK